MKNEIQSLFTNNGVGVGLRPAHYSDFLNQIPQSVSWVEVISDNFLQWKHHKDSHIQSRSVSFLEKIRKEVPVYLHGVSLNIGSADPIDLDYLNRLKKLIEQINPAIVSDHLCWNGVDGQNLHDLMPLPYNRIMLNHVADKIDQVQNFLKRRIVIENPSSYFEFKKSDMTEADFVSELVVQADCGLLLDINNVYVSSVNHSFNALDYFKKIPQNRIAQIHLAGHSVKNGYLIDTHDAPVCSEVWDLYRDVNSRFGKISTMLERDDDIPEWSELEKEILMIRKIQNEKSQ